MNLSEVKIEKLSKVSFDCFLQQIMIICLFYRNEYWRLFIDIEISFDRSESQEANSIYLKNEYINSMKKYYGIELMECSNITGFDSNEIYLVTMNSQYYPLFVSTIENTTIHSFIIYGETIDSYVVHDNYYDATNYAIEKELVAEKAKKIFRVVKSDNWKNRDVIQTSVKENIARSMNIDWKSILHRYEKNIGEESQEFLSSIKIISEYVSTEAVFMSKAINKDSYIKFCVDLLNENAMRICAMYYAFLKESLKHDKIRKGYYLKKSKELLSALTSDCKIKKEVYESVYGEKNLYLENKRVLEEFLEVSIEDKNKKLEDDGIDAYLLIAIISNFELEHNKVDMDLTDFSVKDSYSEFLMKVCKSMLIE